MRQTRHCWFRGVPTQHEHIMSSLPDQVQRYLLHSGGPPELLNSNGRACELISKLQRWIIQQWWIIHDYHWTKVNASVVIVSPLCHSLHRNSDGRKESYACIVKSNLKPRSHLESSLQWFWFTDTLKIHCSNDLTILSSGEKSGLSKTSKILRIGPIATKIQPIPCGTQRICSMC